jgi:hypothetical protein
MKKEMIRLLALQAVVTAGFFVPCLRAQSLGAQHREAQQQWAPERTLLPPPQAESTVSPPPFAHGVFVTAPPIQPPPSWSPAGESTEQEAMTYEHYFRHIENLEQAADHEEQQTGRTGSPWRTHEQRAVGLTNAETETLKWAAFDCNQQLKVQDQKLAVVREAYWNRPRKAPSSTRPTGEYMRLWGQRTRIILDHVAQLKGGLGNTTFVKLDRYVKWNYSPHTYFATNVGAVTSNVATVAGAPQATPRARAEEQPGEDAPLEPVRPPVPPAQVAEAEPEQPPAPAQTEDPGPPTVQAGDVLPCPIDVNWRAGAYDGHLTVDRAGNVYFVADLCVFKLDPSGTITRVAGGGAGKTRQFEGWATNVVLSGPTGLAVDGAGNLFIANGIEVAKVTPGGLLTIVASRCTAGSPCPGAAGNLLYPEGLAADAGGNVYIAEAAGLVERLTPDGAIDTVLRTDTPAAPHGVAVDRGGNLYVADMGSQQILMLDRSRQLTVVAGTSDGGFNGDGAPATAAKLCNPMDVTVDSDGNVYVADSCNDRVRKVTPDGVISTLVDFHGVGYRDSSMTPDHRGATFSSVAAGPDGYVYVYDNRNQQIVKVSPFGEVSIVARTITTAQK